MNCVGREDSVVELKLQFLLHDWMAATSFFFFS